MNNDTYIADIGNYIREHIEPQTTENAIGWEHRQPQTLRGFEIVTNVGARAIFISAALLAILIGLSVATFNAIEKVLLILDILSILLSAVLFVLTTIQNSRKSFRLTPRDSGRKAKSLQGATIPHESTHLQ